MADGNLWGIPDPTKMPIPELGINPVLTMTFQFAAFFYNKWLGRHSRAQKFIDSEILRRCEKYIPLKTGFMIRSGIIHTIIGSGLITWQTPYVRHQYYMVRKHPSTTGKLRYNYWFERMKAVEKEAILRGAGMYIRGEITQEPMVYEGGSRFKPQQGELL